MINKNYFKYLFKSKIIAWVFFGIMFIAISMSSFLTPGNEAADCFRVTTITSLVLSIIMSFALPVFLFSFVHRKRSCDMYFSLPIDRKELLITTITFSFVLIFSYYTISSLFALLFTKYVNLHSICIKYLQCTNYFRIIAALKIITYNTRTCSEYFYFVWHFVTKFLIFAH